MTTQLPSDVWRMTILPYLDLASRIEVNRFLPVEARLVKKVKYEPRMECIAVQSMGVLVTAVRSTIGLRKRVKLMNALFAFAMTPLGRLLLKKPAVANVLLQRIDVMESELLVPLWRTSPSGKRLQEQMERVRDEILRNGFAA